MSNKTTKKSKSKKSGSSFRNASRPSCFGLPPKSQTAQQGEVVALEMVLPSNLSGYEFLSFLRDAIDSALTMSAIRQAMSAQSPPDFDLAKGRYSSVAPYNAWQDDLYNPERDGGRISSWAASRRQSKSSFQPAANVSPEEQRTWRAKIYEWITDAVGPRSAGRTDNDYRNAFKQAYRELMLRHRVDVEARARNAANMYRKAGTTAPGNISPMDFVERLGLGEQLFNIARDIFPATARTDNAKVDAASSLIDPDFRSEPVAATEPATAQPCCSGSTCN